MRLEWDKSGEHYYETGVRQGVLYPVAADGTYPKGVVWNGLTGVTETPSGADSNAQYADDIKYLNLVGAEEFGATITAFTFPEEFYLCDGSTIPTEGLVVGQQNRQKFGFSYTSRIGNDTLGVDYGYKLHLIYGAQASPSERGYQTINDSPEAIEFSWEITTTPVNVKGYKPTALLTIDSTKVDADKLTALEDILYGGENTEARLPLPDEVIALFKGEGTNTSTDPVTP